MKRASLKGLLQKLPLRPILIGLSLGLIGLSLFMIWRTSDIYAKEALIRQQMAQYRPGDGLLGAVATAPLPDTVPVKTEPVVVNQGVVDAQGLNQDIVGWLRLEGTHVDHPFVQAVDNDYYLRRDINGGYAHAGTLFMDYRSNRELTSFSSMIYGHNMRNGTMFSDIGRYNDAGFFNEHQTGWLYLPHATYQLEIVAYLLVAQDDPLVYQTDFTSQRDAQAFLDYMAQYALRYRDLSLTPHDRLLVLSTCTNNRKEMRNVLVTRLLRMQ